jgi:hypothetical protein
MQFGLAHFFTERPDLPSQILKMDDFFLAQTDEIR